MPNGMIVRRLLAASVALLTPSLAEGQDRAAAPDTIASSTAGPGAGTWAAELGIGAGQTATLLRFQSPTSAMLIGADVSWVDISEDVPGLEGVRRERYTLANVTGRIGFRRYRGTAAAVRPFTGLGVLAGLSRSPGGPGWTAGAYGELGASCFFSPHVSLGATGGLQVTYARLKQEFAGGESLTRRQLSIRAVAVQLLGTVYF